MTRARREVISKIKPKLFHDFYYFLMLTMCVAYIAGRMFYVISCVKNGYIGPEIAYMLIALIACIFIIYAYCKEGGVFLDILLWDVQHTDWISCEDFYVSSIITGVFNSITGQVLRIESALNCPQELNFYKNLGEVPESGKAKFYYLKRSKIVIEILSDVTEITVDNVCFEGRKEPVIPLLCRRQIWHIFRKHHFRPFFFTGLILAGVAGMLGFIIYARSEYVYWFIWESSRFWGIIAFFIVILSVFVWLYRKNYKGYWADMLRGEIQATEVIPYNKIVCAKYVNVAQEKVCAVGIRVNTDIYKNNLFVIYNNVSKYWNCFTVDLECFYKGIKYQSGNYEFQAVRFYYLKNSKLVVGVEVIENGRKKK